LLGREQNTVEINTDGGESDPLAADFLVAQNFDRRAWPLRSRRRGCVKTGRKSEPNPDSQ
jgi:hypothetical protein